MNEFSFIKSIQQKTYYQSNLIKGVGDDAAILRETDKDIVTAVDVFTEGVHFSSKTMTPFDIGYKALAANISDIAAMGAVPTSYLIGVVIPDHWTFDELNHIFKGMKELANAYHMDLIGGDTVSGDQLTLSITIIGVVEKNKARYRDQAEEGDIVFVTGTLGDSRAGLHLLANDQSVKNQDYFIARHRRPEPRVQFAQKVKSIERLALNDISDGIANEGKEIAEASNVTLTLSELELPTSEYFNQFTTEQQLQWKLFGGEDFELLGTVSKKDWDMVELAAKETETKVTKIGNVSLKTKNSIYLITKDNKKVILNNDGYTHLSR